MPLTSSCTPPAFLFLTPRTSSLSFTCHTDTRQSHPENDESATPQSSLLNTVYGNVDIVFDYLSRMSQRHAPENTRQC